MWVADWRCLNFAPSATHCTSCQRSTACPCRNHPIVLPSGSGGRSETHQPVAPDCAICFAPWGQNCPHGQPWCCAAPASPGNLEHAAPSAVSGPRAALREWRLLHFCCSPPPHCGCYTLKVACAKDGSFPK